MNHDATLLYVEDSALNQELMRSVIRKRPAIRLLMASSGTEGIEAVKTDRPSLILLDRNLPDMSGVEMLEAIRDVDIDPMPVIIISGDDAQPTEAERSLGVISLVLKPFNVVDLLGQIDRTLQRTR